MMQPPSSCVTLVLRSMETHDNPLVDARSCGGDGNSEVTRPVKIVEVQSTDLANMSMIFCNVERVWKMFA